MSKNDWKWLNSSKTSHVWWWRCQNGWSLEVLLLFSCCSCFSPALLPSGMFAFNKMDGQQDVPTRSCKTLLAAWDWSSSIIHFHGYPSSMYIYIEAQGWGFPGASRNPQSWCYTRKVVLVYRWGGGGGVITSCEVRWMMLNPGRCCSVGRCCYVGFVVVYRRGVGGGGGCNNVMWSALGDVEYHPGRCSSFRPWFSSALSHVLLLNRTTKIKETALQMVSMFHTSLVIHGRCKMFLFQHGQTSSSSAMKMEVRLIKPFQRKT